MVVRFSAAYVHRLVDGRDEDSGYLQSLELVCWGSSAMQQDPGCVGRILAGLLTVGDQAMKRLPIPYEATGETALEMTFTNGSRFHATASGVAVRLAGAGKLVESFAC